MLLLHAQRHVIKHERRLVLGVFRAGELQRDRLADIGAEIGLCCWQPQAGDSRNRSPVLYSAKVASTKKYVVSVGCTRVLDGSVLGAVSESR